jgi:hypothetical protein
LQNEILCSAWKKWIRNPTTRPSSLWRRCNETSCGCCDFWAFPTMKTELRGNKFRGNQEVRRTVCSTFSRSGWSIMKSASLVKRGTSKKRLSPHLHKVLTPSNKVGPRTFRTALVMFQQSSKASNKNRWQYPCCIYCDIPIRQGLVCSIVWL